MRSKRILFISHSASRNGASILLLHLLQWLRANSSLDLEILCCGGGPLVDEYRKVAPTRLVRGSRLLQRLLPGEHLAALRARVEGLLLRVALLGRRFDLVYANTAAAWPQLQALQRRRLSILWHIHELPYALNLLLAGTGARPLATLASRFVAVSKAVAGALTSEFGVDPQRIDLVAGFVDDPGLNESERRRYRDEVLQTSGWPTDAFVVGACGGLGWRKGADLFLQIARECQVAGSRGQTMRFLWIGGSATDVEAMQFAHDLRQLGLDGICRHVPSTPDVARYYAAMDAFALTSREDPFPLVMLEAGAQRVPTICFAGGGGGTEFVGVDAGLVVPYLDVGSFARALGQLQSDPATRIAMGEAARRKVVERHSIGGQAPKLLASIELCLAAR